MRVGKSGIASVLVGGTGLLICQTYLFSAPGSLESLREAVLKYDKQMARMRVKAVVIQGPGFESSFPGGGLTPDGSETKHEFECVFDSERIVRKSIRTWTRAGSTPRIREEVFLRRDGRDVEYLAWANQAQIFGPNEGSMAIQTPEPLTFGLGFWSAPLHAVIGDPGVDGRHPALGTPRLAATEDDNFVRVVIPIHGWRVEGDMQLALEFDSERSFRCRRWQLTAPSGDTVQKMEVESFREVRPGLWIPEKAEQTRNVGGQTISLHYTATSIEILNDIEDEEFALVFPPGTTIFDRVLGTTSAIPSRTTSTRFQELIGTAAPAIDGTAWLNVERPLHWQDLRGSVVLIDFWGTWCSPCVENVPKLQGLYDKYRDKGFVVIGVHSLIGSKKCAAFAKANKLTFPLVLDSGRTARQYEVHALPTYFLVDKAGKVAQAFLGTLPDSTDIAQLLDD